jgi:hypothetical protein
MLTSPLKLAYLTQLGSQRWADDDVKIAAQETIDECLRELRPEVRCRVKNTLTGDGELTACLQLATMSDLSRGGLIHQVHALKALERAADQLRILAAEPAVRALVGVTPVHGAHPIEALERRLTFEERVLLSMAREEIGPARWANVEELIASGAGSQLPLDASALSAIVERIDAKVAQQLEVIEDHRDIQAFSGRWRELQRLFDGAAAHHGAVVAVDMGAESIMSCIERLIGDPGPCTDVGAIVYRTSMTAEAAWSHERLRELSPLAELAARWRAVLIVDDCVVDAEPTGPSVRSLREDSVAAQIPDWLRVAILDRSAAFTPT